MSQRTQIFVLLGVLLVAGVAAFTLFANRDKGPGAVEVYDPALSPTAAPGNGEVADATGPFFLRGEVTDSGGAPLESVEINAFAPDGRTYLVATDNLGRFNIEVRTGDWYRVSFRKNGFSKRTGVPIQPGTEYKRYHLNRLNESGASAVGEETAVPDRIDFAGVVVRYQDRQPLEGIDVQITDSDEIVHEVVTDASGGFQTESLPAGKVVVNASLADHALLYPLQPVDVSAQVRDFLVEMVTTGVVSGTVVDSSSQPVSWGQVEVQYLTSDGARLMPLSQTTPIGPAGDFSFPRVATHRKFRIMAEGMVGTVMTMSGGNFKRGYSGELVLREPGEHEEVRIVLTETVPDVLDAKGDVRLTVLDPDGTPRPDATVRMEWPGGFPASPRALGNGEFEAPIPKDAPLTLRADTADRSGVAVSNVSEASSPLTLTLKPGGRLKVNVKDGAGTPVTNYRIRAEFTQPGDDGVVPMVNHPGVGRLTPVNSSDGSFVYDGMDGGIYRITASKPRMADGIAEHILVRPGEETEIDITLSEGVELTGRVVNSGGAAVPDAVVQISPRKAYAALLEGAAGAVMQTVSDNNGRFLFENLNPGGYDLSANHPDLGSGRLSDFQVPDDGNAEIVLMSGGRLEGTVYDSRGNPVEGASIGIVAGRDKLPTLPRIATSSSGSYAFESLPAGPLAVSCMYPDSAEHLLRSVEIHDGETTVLDFGGQGVRLYGTVLTGNTSVSGAVLRMRENTNLGYSIGSSVTATSDNDGAYEFPVAFQPGAWILTVTVGQATVWYERLEIPSRQDELQHDIALPENTISGRVVSAVDGKAISGAEVVLEADMRPVESLEFTRLTGYWKAIAFARSDDGGSFAFGSVPAGAMRVKVSADGYAPGKTDPMILGSNENREGVTLLLGPESNITGVVTGPQGGIIAGAAVAAFAKDEAGNWVVVSRAQSDSEGGYALGDLGEGTVAVAAVAPGHAVAVEHDVYVPDTNSISVNFALDDAFGGFSLSAMDQATGPVADIRLQIDEGQYWMPWVSHGGTFLSPYGWTGQDGKAICDNLPVGDLVLLFSRLTPLRATRQSVAIENGVRTQVAVTLLTETSP